MPSRRSFLAGAATGSVLLSGCLDRFREDEYDSEDAEESQADLADDLDNVSDEDSTDSGDSDGDQSTSNQAEREEIFDLYTSGIESHNNGATNRDQGVTAYNNDEFDSAISSYQAAESDWSVAEDDLEEAAGIAVEIDHTQARDICDTGAQYVTHLQLSCEDSIAAAEAEQNGASADTINGYIDDAQAHVADAETLNLREPDVLRGVLDLD